jgi:hypothetical protein
MEHFKMADVVQIKKTRTRAGRIVSWSEFEPLLSQLRQKLNCGQHEAMQYLGYAGSTHVVVWRKEDEVPILAVNAIKWVLYESGSVAPQKVIKQFDLNELSRLFALASGIPIPEDQRRAIIAKLAGELAR